MHRIIKAILTLSITVLTLTSTLCFACSGSDSSSNKIQDTEKAAKFFEDELSFYTNPYGVNADINNKKDIVIIDVRAAKDYAAGHIPGAINMPMADYNNFEGSEKEFKGLKKDKLNYVYCYELLCRGALKACKKFASLGYPVKEMKGGFEAWKEHSYPIEKYIF